MPHLLLSSRHSVLALVQRLLTDSLLKLLERDEAALLTVEDGVAQLDKAVPLADLLQVAGRDVLEGADDGPGDVRETVPEVSLMKERHGAGVPERLVFSLLEAGPGLRVGVDAGDLVAVDGGVGAVYRIRVVPATDRR